MSDVQYLRRLGVFHCEVVSQGRRVSQKGVEQFAIEFSEIKSGDKISAVFNLMNGKPKNDFQKKEIERILAACGVEKAKDAVGKQLAVFVAPNEWQGKVMWNPKGYYPLKYFFGEEASASFDPLADEASPAADDLPF